MANYTFVVNDENIINSYGYRVLTGGIRLKTYRTNPLILWMHKRPVDWSPENDKEKEVFPIGTCTKVWSEEGILKADIEFDEKDEFALKVKQKVDDGIIRMCSMGFDVITRSEDAKFLLPGQTRPTVTQCELLEISIVDIGANKNALKLYNSANQEIDIDDILPKLNKKEFLKMKKVIAKLNGFGLNLAEDATEDQIVAALETFQPKTGEPSEKLVNQLIVLGKKTGVVTDGDEGNESKLRKLAKVDFDLFVDMLGIEKLGVAPAAPRTQARMSDLVANARNNAAPAATEKTFDWYEKNDPQALAKMETLEPEKFAKLYAADKAQYES